MQINGEDFLKSVEEQKNKNKFNEELELLHKRKNDAMNDSPDDIEDIILKSGINKKQKLISLLFALMLLFFITIIVIKLISTPTKDNIFVENETNNQQANKIDKEIKKGAINKKLDISKIKDNKDNIKIEDNKTNTTIVKDDIFNINGDKDIDTDLKKDKNYKEEVKPTKITTKSKEPEVIVEKKNIMKKHIQVKKLFKNIKASYIQVGAFLKKPDQNLIDKIQKANYNYIIHKANIKGVTYNKVLVGPYYGYSKAKKELASIRKITNNKTAYIMKIK